MRPLLKRLVHDRRHFFVHAAASAARPVHLAHVATAIASAFATAILGRATYAALRGGGVALRHAHRLAMHALRHGPFVHSTTGTPVFAHLRGWLGVVLGLAPVAAHPLSVARARLQGRAAKKKRSSS